MYYKTQRTSHKVKFVSGHIPQDDSEQSKNTLAQKSIFRASKLFWAGKAVFVAAKTEFCINQTVLQKSKFVKFSLHFVFAKI